MCTKACGTQVQAHIKTWDVRTMQAGGGEVKGEREESSELGGDPISSAQKSNQENP